MGLIFREYHLIVYLYRIISLKLLIFLVITLYTLYFDRNKVSPNVPCLTGAACCATHVCVLVSRHLLQNVMGEGYWILRDIGS